MQLTYQGPVRITVVVTETDPKGNLTQGQELVFNLQYTDKVLSDFSFCSVLMQQISDLKQQLQDQYGVPINKQKIQVRCYEARADMEDR